VYSKFTQYYFKSDNVPHEITTDITKEHYTHIQLTSTTLTRNSALLQMSELQMHLFSCITSSTYCICCTAFHHRFDVDTQAVLTCTLKMQHTLSIHSIYEHFPSCKIVISNPLPAAELFFQETNTVKTGM
jgi:hypothetical protein